MWLSYCLISSKFRHLLPASNDENIFLLFSNWRHIACEDDSADLAQYLFEKGAPMDAENKVKAIQCHVDFLFVEVDKWASFGHTTCSAVHDVQS